MKPFYKDSSFWGFAAFCVVVMGAVSTCVVKVDQYNAVQDAKKAAYEKHIRATCVPLERNRPQNSSRYDTFQCGDVVEWIRVGY